MGRVDAGVMKIISGLQGVKEADSFFIGIKGSGFGFRNVITRRKLYNITIYIENICRDTVDLLYGMLIALHLNQCRHMLNQDYFGVA